MILIPLYQQYYFVIKLNGAHKWIVENSSPRTFNNVKVWASRATHGFPPADAYIKDLGLGYCHRIFMLYLL